MRVPKTWVSAGFLAFILMTIKLLSATFGEKNVSSKSQQRHSTDVTALWGKKLVFAGPVPNTQSRWPLAPSCRLRPPFHSLLWQDEASRPGWRSPSWQPWERGYNRGYGAWEEDNERLPESLRNKVTAIKSLSVETDHEVKNQNKLLAEMDSVGFYNWISR